MMRGRAWAHAHVLASPALPEGLQRGDYPRARSNAEFNRCSATRYWMRVWSWDLIWMKKDHRESNKENKDHVTPTRREG
jgi:hypothetical protein